MAKASTPDRSALDKIAEWAKAEPGVSIGADGTIHVAGDRPLDLTVTVDDERVQLTHRYLEDTTDPENMKKLGLIIVRGDNVVLISPPPR